MHYQTTFLIQLFFSTDATWLSTNYGVIVCIECSGIHREMGVHISKIQSLTLDRIGTSQLLVARVMSNEGFNRVAEANCPEGARPGPSSSMEERKAFIRAKYEERRFVAPLCVSPREVLADLEQAIDSHNIFDLLQAASEAPAHGVDIADPLPSSVSARRCIIDDFFPSWVGITVMDAQATSTGGVSE